MNYPNLDYRESGIEFPPHFIFGSATAAYQIEGAADEDGRGPSIWDTFSQIPGKIDNGDTGAVADDHYHRVEQDLDMIQSLNLQAYRFSISWSRILPNGTGEVNQKGLDFYKRIIDGLLDRGITPTVTLYHWDLPQALQDNGGWTNRETSYAFAEYARILGEAFGDRVATWTTLNEPWCAAHLGHGSGLHAPGLKSHLAVLQAAHHMNLAHGLAIRALREVVTNDPQYSVTLNLHALRPYGPTGAEAVRRIDAVGNRIFTGPMLKGEYPADLLEDTAGITDWSFVLPGDLELINQPIDVLGINYYITKLVQMKGQSTDSPQTDEIAELAGSPWPGGENVEFLSQPGPYTAMGWNIEPSGLEELLLSMSEQFPDLPLMVTESGAAFDDVLTDGSIHDEDRIDYLRRHVTATHRALQKGADVRAFYVWSLMDNFEWSFGYAKRFGIVHVDYETLKRTPKDSALWFADLAKTHRIPN